MIWSGEVCFALKITSCGRICRRLATLLKIARLTAFSCGALVCLPERVFASTVDMELKCDLACDENRDEACWMIRAETIIVTSIAA